MLNQCLAGCAEIFPLAEFLRGEQGVPAGGAFSSSVVELP